MKGPARVLQLVLSLNPGGTERLVVELAKRLHDEVPTAVCCLDEAGAWAPELQRRGIAVSVLGRRPGFHPSLGRQIAREAARHRATVIHAHHYSPFVYGAVARLWRPSIRLLFTEHGRLSDAQPSAKRRAANRLLGSIPHGVFTVSGDLKTHLVQEGFDARSIRVVHNGIDIGRLPEAAERERVRRALGAAPETLVVGTIARLDPVKDLGTLIEGVSRVRRERPARLVIIGDGPEMRPLSERVRALNLSADVTFLGHRDDARDWLAGVDVFANSSTSEGVSLTILEAMAAGVPIVATAVGGTPEVVDAASGLLVPARDPGAFARAIGRLSDDHDLRATMARAARARVEAHFTLTRMVNDYRGEYVR